MADTRLCPQCEAELPSDTPEGLCPKCLLAVGLDDSESEQPEDADAATIAPSESDSPGSPLGTKVHYFGDYELLEEIARGGMGVVYKARQVKLNRAVALKMILAGQLASEDDVKRFHTEAEAAANLQHANIVAIHEVGEHEGQHYFSMDYVDGPSLAEVVRQRPLGAKKAAEYVKTIAEAIHYAHGQGTLHRDLKPSNILIDQSDQPRITDFGLAKRIEGDSKLTASGAVLGTPSYMPPEQAAANRGLIGPASDVYSLGAVLYELLTGRPPFQTETPLETLMQVLERQPVSPRKRSALVPIDLETICLKCLEKRPEQRYGSAGELADDLERFLNHQPIVARPTSAVRKAASWLKQRPWIIILVATLCLLGLVAVAYWQWSQIQYLHWVMDHPQYERQPDTRTAQLETVRLWTVFVFLATVGACSAIDKNYKRRKAVGSALSPRVSAACAVFGALGTVFGAYLLLKGIDAYVWEEHFSFGTIFLAYFCCTSAVELICRAAREHELYTHGTSNIIPENVGLPLVTLVVWPIMFALKLLFLPVLIYHGWSIAQIISVFFGASHGESGGVQETPHPSTAAFPSSQRPEIDELSEQQIAAIGELLLADKKFEAVRQYQEATDVNHSRAESFIDEFESDLFQRHPERIPPDPRWLVFQGCLALLSLIIVPLVLLAFIVGLISGDPHTLAGLIGCGMSAGATVLYRKNNSQLTRHQLVFAMLFFVGIASLAMFHPISSILIGSLIGVAAGILCVCFSPLLRPLFSLEGSTGSVMEQPAPSVNWKNRLVKAVVISSIAGVIVGLVPGIAMLASGSIDSDERIEFMMFVVAFPVVIGLVFAGVAAAAIGTMRYITWIIDGSTSNMQHKSDERFDDN